VVWWPARRIDPRRQQVKVERTPGGDDTERVVLALHKPPGYVRPGSSRRAADVYDCSTDVGRWVFPVGRLDRDSAGCSS